MSLAEVPVNKRGSERGWDTCFKACIEAVITEWEKKGLAEGL
jgi:hypothetical protein